MFAFEFDAALLTFAHHNPASAALFQLPPTIGKTSHY